MRAAMRGLYRQDSPQMLVPSLSSVYEAEIIEDIITANIVIIIIFTPTRENGVIGAAA
jgi:hypothetical protein